MTHNPNFMPITLTSNPNPNPNPTPFEPWECLLRLLCKRFSSSIRRQRIHQVGLVSFSKEDFVVTLSYLSCLVFSGLTWPGLVLSVSGPVFSCLVVLVLFFLVLCLSCFCLVLYCFCLVWSCFFLFGLVWSSGTNYDVACLVWCT